jgi:hypothetical protein
VTITAISARISCHFGEKVAALDHQMNGELHPGKVLTAGA